MKLFDFDLLKGDSCMIKGVKISKGSVEIVKLKFSRPVVKSVKVKQSELVLWYLTVLKMRMEIFSYGL